MAKKIEIIGAGNVGRALARGLERAGHEVWPVGNDEAAVRNVAPWADDVILAVPFGAIGDVVREAGDGLDGKLLIDVTNALDGDMNLALGFTTSGAEELQRKVPKAKVVKSFNTVFAEHVETGRLGDEPLTAFVAGDDPAGKQKALALARDVGFDAVDVGPLENARLIEPLGYLNIQLGFGQKMGKDLGIDPRRG